MSLRTIFVIMIVLYFYSDKSLAQCPIEEQIPNQYIVRLKPTAKNSFHNFLHKDTVAQRIHKNAPFLVKTKDRLYLQARPEIESVEPDCKMYPLYSLSPSENASAPWGFQKIRAGLAWPYIPKNAQPVIVAVSDTGVDHDHIDLKNMMWINASEISNNGIDDDQNGCVDDVYGCDLADYDGNPIPPPHSEAYIHGTHVAGIIAAQFNNFSHTVGVSPISKVMAVKGFKDYSAGVASTSDLLATLYYAAQEGAQVINCSWGRKGTPTNAEIEAFRYVQSLGIVVVAAAGNGFEDVSAIVPASLPGVIAVGATDSNDSIASFSNWGNRIDIFAPGGKGFNISGLMLDGILSTLPRDEGSYGELIGTSMSAPFIAGVASMILSVNSKFSPQDVLKIIKNSSDPVVYSVNEKTFSQGRVNAEKAMQMALVTQPTQTSNPCSDCSQTKAQEKATSQQMLSSTSTAACGFVDNNTPKKPKADTAMLGLPLIALLILRFRNRFRLYLTN